MPFSGLHGTVRMWHTCIPCGQTHIHINKTFKTLEEIVLLLSPEFNFKYIVSSKTWLYKCLHLIVLTWNLPASILLFSIHSTNIQNEKTKAVDFTDQRQLLIFLPICSLGTLMNQKSLVKSKMQVSKMFLIKKWWLPLSMLLQLEARFRQEEWSLLNGFWMKGALRSCLRREGEFFVICQLLDMWAFLESHVPLSTRSFLTSEH